MGHFFHAVAVFFHHLAAVKWEFLAYAIACHVIKLLFRAGAWRHPECRVPEAGLKFRSVFGAYIAGVGVNSVVPARGGDVVKLYLVKHRMPGSSYATLTPTLIVETLFDFVTAGALIIWAMASACCRPISSIRAFRLSTGSSSQARELHRDPARVLMLAGVVGTSGCVSASTGSASACGRGSQSSTTATVRPRRDRAAVDLVFFRIASLYSS